MKDVIVNFKVYLPLVLGVAALLLHTACSDNFTGQTVTSNQENITGSWLLSCYSDGGNGAEFTLNFSGELAWTIENWLGDTACRGASDWSWNGNTDITFVGTNTVSGVTVSRYNWLDTAQTAKTNNDAATEEFVATGAFGTTNWSTDVGRNVLGVAVSGGSEATSGKGIIYVDTSVSPNEIWLGDEDGALDSSDYPISLGDGPYRKQ